MDDQDIVQPQIELKPSDPQDGEDKEEGPEGEDKLLGPERRNSIPGVIPSPMATASIFSKYVSFWWLNPLLALGKKKPLQEGDFYGLCKEDTTDELGEKLQNEWEKERYKAESKGKKPSLGKAMFRAFGKAYIMLGLFAVVIDSLRIVQPLLLGKLITYFEKESKMAMTDAFLYALGVSLCSFCASFFNVPFAFLRQRYGMQLRIACTSLVYRKTLQLSSAALAQTTTGNIVNLVSTDTQKFDFACFFLHYLILGPLEALVVVVFLYMEIGPACFAGMGLLLLLVPAQIYMGRILMRVRRCAAKWIDERVKVMNEVISGMKVIKMYTWEDSFASWIDKIRKTELKWFKRLQLVRGIFISFFFTSGPLISFLTFMTYVLTGNVLTARKVFTAVSLFNSVRMVMSLFFPLAITLMNEGKVSIERIEKMLSLDEMHSEGLITSKLRPKPEHCGIFVEKITASWKEDLPKPTLKDISFELTQGELLGVIGPVGAGKSSLLMAILGELPLSEGTITVRGKVGYASQQAWIYNGTLQQNIIFGSEYNESKYQEVIAACALERDIELLSEGDMTLVGERGVSLSGGQKARVNLARAVYSDSDVYLLDDPLSAVDTNVGRHLFDKCINGYLAQKPRILVTHQLQYLKEVDQLLVLSEGECIGQGSYHELAKSNVDFMSLLIEELDEDSAIESDSESGEVRVKHKLGRQFSRQASIISGRGRSDSRRCSSYRHSEMFDSTVSVTTAVTDVSIFEENVLPKETKQEGAVTLDTYLQYVKALKSLGAAVFVFVLFVLCQGLFLMNDWWLSFWSNKEEVYGIQQKALREYNSSATNTTLPVVDKLERDIYLAIYAALVAGLLIFTIARTEIFFGLSVAASRKFHQGMFSCVIRAPSYFFDTNSIGRILNRFSKDLGLIDDMMPFTVCDFAQTLMVVLGILCLIAANNPITFVVVIPVVILFFWLRQHYMHSSREIKRIEGITRSPLFGHFSTTLLGLDTIRAFGVEETFIDQVNMYQDTHTRAWFTFIAAQAWLTYRLEILCVIFISFTSLVSPALRDQLSAGVVGLTLSYAINLTGVFNQCVKQSTEMENMMTSVERVVEYCNLESEAPPETDTKPPKNWPPKGQITMDDMSFSYHRSLPRVLHHITCCIKPREKIGVVGRTGAGKSSLLSTLFRLAEPTGLIEIDGVNISELGLKDLRRKLSIIPQDPVIFSGTMRKNIDPFNEHDDVELWKVLDEVQLKSTVEDLPGKMDTELAEAGSNFSVGQRQLVCLARAILRHSRILVIDEATANVDPITDSLIQATIREKFKKCTVLTIAHRLHTIMDSDRVMVLDAGRLKEFDAPYTLLKNPRSLFSKLVSQTGPEETKRLYEIARSEYYKDKTIPEDEPDSAPDPQSNGVAKVPDVAFNIPDDEKSRLLQLESAI